MADAVPVLRLCPHYQDVGRNLKVPGRLRHRAYADIAVRMRSDVRVDDACINVLL